jgi:hypothetical protein
MLGDLGPAPPPTSARREGAAPTAGSPLAGSVAMGHDPSEGTPPWAFVLTVAAFSVCCGLPLLIIAGEALLAAYSVPAVGAGLAAVVLGISVALTAGLFLDRRRSRRRAQAPLCSSSSAGLPGAR